MKTFLIPCFVIAKTNSKEEADQLAADAVKQNNCYFLLDEELPTIEIKLSAEQALPHTMKGLYNFS